MAEISVLCYVYNSENFLNDSLNSLLNQSFHDFELICVDDGSTDNSLSILKKFSKKDKRIRFISLNHGGFSKSINTVLDLCVGKYVYFMNIDSKFKFYALGFMYEQIEEKKADFIFTNINYEYDNLYYNKSNSMNLISEKMEDKPFNFRNLEDLIFGIDDSLENKFFKLDFLRDNEIAFSNDSMFPNIIFYYESLLSAKKVFFLRDFLFENRKPLDLPQLKYTSLENVYDSYESIIKLFEEHGQYERFEKNFLDLKISLLMKFYSKIKEESKQDYYNRLRNELIEDFTSGRLSDESIINLSDFNRKIFEQILISESFYEFDLLRKHTFESVEYNRLMDRKSFLKLVKNQSIE